MAHNARLHTNYLPDVEVPDVEAESRSVMVPILWAQYEHNSVFVSVTGLN